MNGHELDNTILQIASALARVETKVEKMELTMMELESLVSSYTGERNKVVGGFLVFTTLLTAIGGVFMWLLNRIWQ